MSIDSQGSDHDADPIRIARIPHADSSARREVDAGLAALLHEEAEPVTVATRAVQTVIEQRFPAGDVAHAAADRLVREALARGHGTFIEDIAVERLAGGNTAMMVARVKTMLSFVVKVDSSPALVDEARLLERIAADPELPAVTRDAFPQVYAVTDSGPVFGYLMEDLSEFKPLSASLDVASDELLNRLVIALWSRTLEPTYSGTRHPRLIPNVVEDYVHRARERLIEAAASGLGPALDQRLAIRCDGQELAVGTIADALDAAEEQVASLAPRFSTFVHGDPNPENVLWQTGPGGGGYRFRLIDPKAWYRGDYLFDVAKLCHYLRVTHPVARHGIRAEVAQERGRIVIAYSRTRLKRLPRPEALLMERVKHFATDPERPDTPRWRRRFDLAVAMNLLGIVGPRLSSAARDGDRGDADLGWIALGEGLRLLHVPARRR